MDDASCVMEVIFDDAQKPVDLWYLETNERFEQHSGMPDARGRLLSEFYPNADAYWLEFYGRVALTGLPARTESQFSDTQRWYDVCAFKAGGPESRRVGVLFRDITESRRALESLRGSEGREALLLKLSDALRPLADPLEVQSVAVRLLGEHLGANQAHYGEAVGDFVDIHQGYGDGLPPMVGRFRHMDFGERSVATYRAGQTAICYDVATDSTITESEAAVITGFGFRAYIAVPLVKDGRWVAILAAHSIEPRAWTPGEVALVEEVADRTWAAVERARAEEGKERLARALRESEERFRLAAAATHALVYDLNVLESRFTGMYGSPALIGHPPEGESPTQAWWERQIHPEDVEAYRETLGSLVRTPHDQVQRYRLCHPDGRMLFMEDHATPVCDADGQVVRVVGTAVDITERELARRGLESLLASRSEFLATCSHELKTPLTVLLASIEILQYMLDTLDEARRARFLSSMSNQARKLDRLVTDLLDVSRIESGHLTLNPTPTSLDDLVGRVVSDFGRTCQTHVIVTSQLRECVAAVDQVRFEQMLMNLLTNAAKYSEEGTTITVSLGSANGFATVAVADQGCGVPESDIAKLFELYYRHPSTGAKSGLGMGLHVARELAHLHGGAITVESRLGEGSTFTLRLPLWVVSGM